MLLLFYELFPCTFTCTKWLTLAGLKQHEQLCTLFRNTWPPCCLLSKQLWTSRLVGLPIRSRVYTNLWPTLAGLNQQMCTLFLSTVIHSYICAILFVVQTKLWIFAELVGPWQFMAMMRCWCLNCREDGMEVQGGLSGGMAGWHHHECRCTLLPHQCCAVCSHQTDTWLCGAPVWHTSWGAVGG